LATRPQSKLLISQQNLVLLTTQYLDALPADVGKRIVSAEGVVAYRRTAQHFADVVTAEYPQLTYADALAAYRAEQERRRQAEQEAWRQFFVELKAMTNDELIAYIGGRCHAEVVELAREKHEKAAFDVGLYKARLKCAKRHLGWRGLTMPAMPTRIRSTRPGDAWVSEEIPVVKFRMVEEDLPDLPGSNEIDTVAMYARLKARQAVQP